MSICIRLHNIVPEASSALLPAAFAADFLAQARKEEKEQREGIGRVGLLCFLNYLNLFQQHNT